jgi:hypothetical protein
MPKPRDMLSKEDAKAAVKAMTAGSYNHAGDILEKMFLGCNYKQAKNVLMHVGRFAEKCGPYWPKIPWEK